MVYVADVTDRVMAVVDVATLDVDRVRRVCADVSPATVDAYLREIPRFEGWCHPPTYGAPPPRWWTPRPCTDETLALYIDDGAQHGRAPATLTKARSAIVWWHRLHGSPVPDGRPASVVLSRYKDTLRAAGWSPKRTVPLTFEHVVRIVAGLDWSTPRGERDAAMLWLMFAAALLPNRVAALRLCDVAERADGLYVRGGPAGDGELLESSALVEHWTVDGQHRPAVCPVEGVLPWVRRLTGRGAGPLEPLMRPVDKHGHIAGLDDVRAGVPLADGGCGMAAQGLGYAFAGLLIDGGIDDPGRFSPASARAGGLVHLRAVGATIDQLAAVGGLSTHSATLLEYVRHAERAVAGGSEDGGTGGSGNGG